MSIIYTANTAPQAVPVNGTISLGGVIRKCGRHLSASGGVINVMGSGYYKIDTLFNILGTAAGAVTVTLFKDGIAIPGASATVTVGDGGLATLNIPAVVREMCCCESTITAELSGTAATINTASAVVSKI